ncbi:hypothetical protein JZ751_000092 [Albula glossodonta]|uniref:RING-type domain-containing protein n=1 Tax=Albula glossodonta TaxID=121402 RepID=A0A8T2PVC8_9TELE|nr:hypothetical protein JZ751_000092 [Albula glossodonta]
MTGDGMDLLRRIFSAIGFDCLRRAPSSMPSTRVKAGVAQATSAEGGSQSCGPSLGPEQPHCQCCIAFDVRLKRLACGHQYCDPCTDRIVNQAFQDIEGLSDYPCPMCQSIRRLGGEVPNPTRPRSHSGVSCSDVPRAGTPQESLRDQVISEEEEEEEEEPPKD